MPCRAEEEEASRGASSTWLPVLNAELPEVKTLIQLPRRHEARQGRRGGERFDLPPDTSDLLMTAVQAMRTKLLGIFERPQCGEIRDVRTVTENSVQIHHKEHGFSVTVREVVTLGSYLAMSAPEPGGAPSGRSPVKSFKSRLEARNGWRIASMVTLLRQLNRKSAAEYHPEAT
jgi:hypothetical protein